MANTSVNFPVSKYATLEMNRAAYLKNGLVVSQTPLAAAFTDAAPCENGMWVDADKANGEIKLPSSATKIYGIVYTTEKEFDIDLYGMKNYCAVGGEYPRVGILHVGDTFTTNCFQYDSGEFEDMDALEAALKAAATTPVYVVPVANSGRPKLTASAPASGAYGRVIKYTTVPNGEKGVKYNMVVA